MLAFAPQVAIAVPPSNDVDVFAHCLVCRHQTKKEGRKERKNAEGKIERKKESKKETTRKKESNWS